MSLARFKDISLDAAEPHRLGAFWAAVLGRDLEELADGDVVLRGPTPRHTVWVTRVPEPRTVKHRMHLDVHTPSVDALLALGATVVETFPRWTVMADPEGGEFCAFVRAEVPAERLYELGLDAAAPTPVAAWWADLLGGRLDVGTEFSAVGDIPGAPFGALVVAPVPEPKRAKNRVHIDVVGDVREIVARGATVLAEHPRWTVLADPWGDEFCAFPPDL